MKRTIYRVLPDKTERWLLVGPESREAFRFKYAAVAAGIKAARAVKPSQLVIYLRNGRIEEERTYGSDPRRYKG